MSFRSQVQLITYPDSLGGREVVRRLMRLIRLRNEHPAFGGTFHILPAKEPGSVTRERL